MQQEFVNRYEGRNVVVHRIEHVEVFGPVWIKSFVSRVNAEVRKTSERCTRRNISRTLREESLLLQTPTVRHDRAGDRERICRSSKSHDVDFFVFPKENTDLVTTTNFQKTRSHFCFVIIVFTFETEWKTPDENPLMPVSLQNIIHDTAPSWFQVIKMRDISEKTHHFERWSRNLSLNSNHWMLYLRDGTEFRHLNLSHFQTVECISLIYHENFVSRKVWPDLFMCSHGNSWCRVALENLHVRMITRRRLRSAEEDELNPGRRLSQCRSLRLRERLLSNRSYPCSDASLQAPVWTKCSKDVHRLNTVLLTTWKFWRGSWCIWPEQIVLGRFLRNWGRTIENLESEYGRERMVFSAHVGISAAERGPTWIEVTILRVKCWILNASSSAKTAHAGTHRGRKALHAHRNKVDESALSGI